MRAEGSNWKLYLSTDVLMCWCSGILISCFIDSSMYWCIDYLVDDLLLLGVFLSQTGHFSPKGLILTETHRIRLFNELDQLQAQACFHFHFWFWLWSRFLTVSCLWSWSRWSPVCPSSAGRRSGSCSLPLQTSSLPPDAQTTPGPRDIPLTWRPGQIVRCTSVLQV